jgi:U3 small nucleolar RNA-associated protein 14
MIALFLVMDFDHLVVLRGAPHGSFLNKVERSMSLLNLGLQHVALVRKQMEPWAETVLSSASSMAEVRKMVAEWERYKDAEMTRLGARLAEILDANDLSDALSAADDDNENDVVVQAMNEVNRTLSTQGTMSVLMYLTIIFHC